MTEVASNSAQSPPPAGLGRRAEYAEATRVAVMDAARRLFTERGFFATTVREIADGARVSQATVYAVGGGKEALLKAWVKEWLTGSAFAESYDRLRALDEADAILRMTAEVVGNLRSEWGDIMQVASATAPHHKDVASSLLVAQKQYMKGFINIANRLCELRALREDVGVERASQVLWFYFGFRAYDSLVEDNGWSYAQAEYWLYESARTALLRDQPAAPQRT